MLGCKVDLIEEEPSSRGVEKSVETEVVRTF
jgi:hypothetical protein